MNIAKAWAAQLDDYAIDLAWSPDGRVLAAASASGPITLFEGAGGARRATLAGHPEGTNAVAWASAVGRVVPNAPLRDGANSGRRVGDNPPYLLASGGQDGCVRFWDCATGVETANVEFGHGEWVELLGWRPTATFPVSGIRYPALAAAAGRKLRLLTPDGVALHEFPAAAKTLSALAWHPQGGAIAVAWFGGVCVWDAGDFHAQRESVYGSGIPTLLWSPDGRWLVAGAQDNAVHLWRPDQDEEFHMSGYETKVRDLSFSSDSRWLATGGARDACVWDCSGAGPAGREPVALPHADRVCAVAFAHADELLATAARNGDVGLWRPTRGEPRVANVKLTAPASRLAWRPDDTMLAIGAQKGGVLVLRVEG